MIRSSKIWRSFSLVVIFAFVLPAQAQRGDFEQIDFTLAETRAEQYKGEDLYAVPILVHKLTANLQTDVEKFRAIYLWVCQNIKGDYHLMVENDQMRRKLKTDTLALMEWNAGFKKEIFQILRKRKRTTCSGYSYLIKEMSELAGLECAIVDGYGPINKLKEYELAIPNHSWNAVKLNDKWYLCDATWAAGYTDLTTYLFEFDYDDQYWLMPPEEFAKTHQPEDPQWTLLPLAQN